MNHRISLVIPATPGDAHFLPELLRTIQRGSVVPDEVIISISQGDRVPVALIQEIEAAFGGIGRAELLLSSDRLLAAANRNNGARLATSDVVTFLDADDIPHRQLLEVMNFMFQDPNVMHVNHAYTMTGFADAPISNISVVPSEQLYAAYFPDGVFSSCPSITRAYGGGLPVNIPVTAGHTSVRRVVLDDVHWKDPVDQLLGVAEDYEFCMEVLFKHRRSVVIDAVLSWYRPSLGRGTNPHGHA